MSETAIVIAIRLALGKLEDFVVWRNQTGVATYYTEKGKQMFVPFGLCKGSSDLIGILAPVGRLVALEVKTIKGKPTKEQLLFVQLVRHMGGFGAVIRSVEEAVAAIERARKGETE